jgi:hypothetical protein
MEDITKQSTIELSKILNKSSRFFLVDYIEKIDDAHTQGIILEIINIVFSAHISSIYSTLMFITEDHKEIQNAIKTFLDKLLGFIATQHIVEVWRPNDRI